VIGARPHRCSIRTGRPGIVARLSQALWGRAETTWHSGTMARLTRSSNPTGLCCRSSFSDFLSRPSTTNPSAMSAVLRSPTHARPRQPSLPDSPIGPRRDADDLVGPREPIRRDLPRLSEPPGRFCRSWGRVIVGEEVDQRADRRADPPHRQKRAQRVHLLADGDGQRVLLRLGIRLRDAADQGDRQRHDRGHQSGLDPAVPAPGRRIEHPLPPAPTNVPTPHGTRPPAPFARRSPRVVAVLPVRRRCGAHHRSRAPPLTNVTVTVPSRVRRLCYGCGCDSAPTPVSRGNAPQHRGMQ
jgi:hypothetical protein